LGVPPSTGKVPDVTAAAGLAGSGYVMGLDFRDYNNDGFPDIVFVALPNQTSQFFQNTGKGDFKEVTTPSGMRGLSRPMSGFGAAPYDFDNDGWKDLFVSGGHVESRSMPGQPAELYNTVFRNLGSSGTWQALTEEAGRGCLSEGPASRLCLRRSRWRRPHRCSRDCFGQDAEIWMNRSHRTPITGCKSLSGEPRASVTALVRRSKL
jgi:FG-GAP-like repeat